MTAPRLPNLFKVPELKEKILFTLLCLVVYRVGAHIATPGVNVQALADFLRNQGQGTLFSLYDLFAGGSFGRATVFALASCRTSRRASSSSWPRRCSPSSRRCSAT